MHQNYLKNLISKYNILYQELLKQFIRRFFYSTYTIPIKANRDINSRTVCPWVGTWQDSISWCIVQPDVESSTMHRLTTTGEEGVVFNGVPDWLYEGQLIGVHILKIKGAVIVLFSSRTIPNLSARISSLLCNLGIMYFRELREIFPIHEFRPVRKCCVGQMVKYHLVF